MDLQVYVVASPERSEWAKQSPVKRDSLVEKGYWFKWRLLRGVHAEPVEALAMTFSITVYELS